MRNTSSTKEVQCVQSASPLHQRPVATLAALMFLVIKGNVFLFFEPLPKHNTSSRAHTGIHTEGAIKVTPAGVTLVIVKNVASEL